MKQTLAISMIAILTAGSLLASGADDNSNHTKIEREAKECQAAESVKVLPSEDILEIFSDEDNDYDDLFEKTKPFLTGEKDRNEIPNDVSTYIRNTVSEDPDDLIETINNELKAELNENVLNETHMVLGTYKFKAIKIKAEGEPTYIRYEREILGFTPIGSVTVKPSDDILTVFSDNDDDDLYDETRPFLTGENNRNNLTKSSADYIYKILSEDEDDIMETIREELKAPLIKGKIEMSEMSLGNYKITATLEAPNVYKFRTEEIFYKPESEVKIQPTSDILSVFEDNDDDSLYEEALPYLKSETAGNVIPESISNYISDVINKDYDDLLEKINDELFAAVSNGTAESVILELGPYAFKASVDFKN